MTFKTVRYNPLLEHSKGLFCALIGVLFLCLIPATSYAIELQSQEAYQGYDEAQDLFKAHAKNITELLADSSLDEQAIFKSLAFLESMGLEHEMEYHLKSWLKQADKKEHSEIYRKAYTSLLSLYLKYGTVNQALDIAYNQAAYYTRIKDQEGLARAYKDLAILSYLNDDANRATAFIQMAEETYSKKSASTEAAIQAYSYQLSQKTALTEEWRVKALRELQTGQKNEVVNTYFLAKIQENRGYYTEAINLFGHITNTTYDKDFPFLALLADKSRIRLTAKHGSFEQKKKVLNEWINGPHFAYSELEKLKNDFLADRSNQPEYNQLLEIYLDATNRQIQKLSHSQLASFYWRNALHDIRIQNVQNQFGSLVAAKTKQNHFNFWFTIALFVVGTSAVFYLIIRNRNAELESNNWESKYKEVDSLYNQLRNEAEKSKFDFGKSLQDSQKKMKQELDKKETVKRDKAQKEQKPKETAKNNGKAEKQHPEKSVKLLDFIDRISALDKFQKSEDRINSFNKLLDELPKNASKEKVWELIERFFEKEYPDWLRTLEEDHPELSTQEIRYCACIKLGLENKQIAQIFSVKNSTVSSAKGKIKRKVGLKDMPEFEEYLSSRHADPQKGSIRLF